MPERTEQRPTKDDEVAASPSPQYVQSQPVTQAEDEEQMPEEEAAPGVYWDEENKDHSDYGDTAGGPDALTHLLMAWRLMIDDPACAELLGPLMELIHAKQELMTAGPEEVVVLPVSVGGDEEYGKVIRYEDNQYCVYSDTGRAFGCYATEDAANERLAQMESYSDKRLAAASDDRLIRWHQGFHRMTTVTAQDSLAHDLVEDELVRRGFDRALEMLNRDSPRNTIMKQDESRYTLGPAYVPDMTDAHGEFTDPDTLQRALWEWVRKDDRRIFLQHSEKQAGEMVEVLTWPFAISAEMVTPNQGVTKFEFPANTPVLGVIWEDWAWDMVKAGELRGYSIGGRARRVEVEFD
jgi:hypothetical protein